MSQEANGPAQGGRKVKKPWIWPKNLKSVGSGINSIVVALAIFAAGWWFWTQGESSPKANITQSIIHRQMDNQWVWVHLSVRIRNAGKTPLQITSGNIRLDQILPLDGPIVEAIKLDKPLIPEGETRVKWPAIAGPYKAPLDLRIESGEEDSLSYEFVIPKRIRTIRVYSHFAKKEDPQIG
jgi:hypothetical protein